MGVLYEAPRMLQQSVRRPSRSLVRRSLRVIACRPSLLKERKVMNDKFDELAKGLAQSVTRRGALKQFGVGLAGIALALLGMPNVAQAGPRRFHCHCGSLNYGCDPNS